MSMKHLSAPLALGLASMPLAAGCILTTDFEERTGATIWTVEDPSLPEGRSVVALPDGGFVVGVSTAGHSSVLRFDADGQPLWAQSAALADRELGGLALSPAGNVLVVGTIPIDEALATGELWVGELSVEDGSEQWSASSGIPLESTHGEAIAVDPEGGLRVTGSSNDSVVLMASLGPDGALQWWQEAPELGTDHAHGTDVLVLPDGSAVFVGTSGGGGPSPFWARRVDAMGTELWTESLAGPGTLAGNWTSIERRDDGALVVVGTAFSSSGGAYETPVVELDEDGAQQQLHTWERVGVGQVIFGSALALDGTLYLAGTKSYGALGEHGEPLWSQLLDGNAFRGHARDAAILSDGSIVFVGSISTHEETQHLWIRKTEP